MKCCLLILLVASCQVAAPVTQPLEFNHERHMKADMECISCHASVEDRPLATLPTIDKCMECHEEARGTNPEEPKVRAFAARGEEIPWVRVNRLPGHVYFSHAAHVTLGELKCEQCHGDVAAAAVAFATPNVHLDMEACMSCHDDTGANNGCLTCHK
jgi:menaquinone reductase, multiheme cytochrome c subunit